MGMEKFDMYAQLYESQCRFKTACDQIVLLNSRMDGINRRYAMAKNNNNQIFQYSLRMRIIIVEGLLTTYCQYACLKKNEILDLRFKLYGEDPDDGERIYDDIVSLSYTADGEVAGSEDAE